MKKLKTDFMYALVGALLLAGVVSAFYSFQDTSEPTKQLLFEIINKAEMELL